MLQPHLPRVLRDAVVDALAQLVVPRLEIEARQFLPELCALDHPRHRTLPGGLSCITQPQRPRDRRAAIGAADLLSVRVVKPQVARPRPCSADPVHVAYPLGCGSGLSFPSSHASDTAAAAAVFGWAAPRLSAIGVALVVLVGVSRVY